MNPIYDSAADSRPHTIVVVQPKQSALNSVPPKFQREEVAVFKRKLTEVAVDSFTEYLQEKFEKLKELDLDQDGRKDVDQVIEILGRCAETTKATIDATNFPNLAAGIESVVRGIDMCARSLDKDKLGELGQEVAEAAKKLSALGELSIQHVKKHGFDQQK